MRRINTTITEHEWTAMQDLATRSGIAFADLVRRAIDAYVRQPDVTLTVEESTLRKDVDVKTLRRDGDAY